MTEHSVDSAAAASTGTILQIILESLPLTIIAFFFYFMTSSSHIGFGDTAILVNAIEQGIVVSHVNNHPLTVVIGWIFSQFHNGEPAASANFLSVCFGTLTVLLWFVAVRIAGTTKRVALISGFPVMVMHSVWWHSTIVENYAVSAALVMAVYAALAQMDRSQRTTGLYLACFLAGFSVLNHVQNSFLCVGVAFSGFLTMLRSQKPVKTLLFCGGAALLGLAPWFGLIIRDAMVGQGLGVAVSDALVGKFESTFFAATLYSMVWDTLFIIWNQSPLLLLPISACIGVVWYARTPRGTSGLWGMLVHITITILVFSGYPTWDRFAFLLPSIVGLAFFSGLGLQTIVNTLGAGRGLRVATTWSLATLLVAPTVYVSVPFLARDSSSVWARRFGNGHSANLYDQASFIASPYKAQYQELERFAQLLKDKLPPYSIFLDDDSRTYYTLADYYQRYRNLRTDVKFLLVNSWGFSNWGLESEQLSSVMHNAFLTGKPFFVPSIGYPYAKFLDAAKAKFNVSFTQFPLGPNRWIYKLNTLPDGLQEARNRAASAIQAEKLTPIRISAASGESNLTTDHILFSSADNTQQQIMSTFGPNWVKGDQVFVSSALPGSQVEFFLIPRLSSAGSTALSVSLTTAPDFGEVVILADGVKVGELDLYTPIVDRVTKKLPNVTISSLGTILELRVVGKNKSSSGYNFGVDTLSYQ